MKYKQLDQLKQYKVLELALWVMLNAELANWETARVAVHLLNGRLG